MVVLSNSFVNLKISLKCLFKNWKQRNLPQMKIAIFFLLFSIFTIQSIGIGIQIRLDHLVSLLVTSTNQFNKLYGQLTGRHDFNQWLKKRDWAHHSKQFPDPEYDFIIVGSGPAGSVIANRLSEIRHWKILLLEAGEPETQVMGIPLVAPIYQNTSYDWTYLMEYEEGIGRGLLDNRMLWPRGKALGGTSVINYMIYTRGNPIDFDRWGANNPGWSYPEALCYYKKSENARIEHHDPNYHGTEGYLSVENIFKSVIIDAMIAAGNQLGIPYADYNAPTQSFVMDSIQATVLNGRRHSAANAFLWPVRDRPNLDIITSAFVTRILIDPYSKRTYGVQYVKDGISNVVRARKEVILSAGTFNSAQLLMLAGIGPADHLAELGIPLLEDLPVGQNLHDHLTFPGLAFLINDNITIAIENVLTSKTINDFINFGTNRLTSLGGVEGISYIKTVVSKEVEPYPDIELLLVEGSLAVDFGIITRVRMRISDEVFRGLFQPIVNLPQWTMFPMLLHPKSIGYLKLRSANPYDPPILHGNFFSDYEDIQTFIAAIRVIQAFAATPALQYYGSTLNPNPTPGCEHWEFDSDAYWECSLRSISVTLHHQVGTVKMGPADDPSAVVNHELKVYGVSGLRVADCSVIPFAISAHTNAPSYMVGENAADIIKRNWGVLEKPCHY